MISVMPLLMFLLFGYLLQRFISEANQELWADSLNRFVIYISLPSLVFVYMIDLKIDSKYILPIASAWAIFVISSIVILLLSRLLEWRKTLTGALLMTIPYGNTSFLGVPFTKAFFGDMGVSYAVIYDQLGSFLILSTIGLVVVSIYSGQKTSINAILYKIFTFPAFVVLIIVMPLNSSMIAQWVMNILSILAQTLTPAALLSIGLYLKLKLAKEHMIPMSIGLGIKLVLAPFLLLIYINIFGSNSLVSDVTILESAMAPMVSSSMLAIMAGLEKRFVASVLGYGIILSFGTIPIFFYIILRSH